MGSGTRTVPISVLVPTRNEEKNILKCLESVSWADEVYVVDSRSDDRTAEIATRQGATVVEFSWDGKGPRKFNWALEHLPWKHEWVLVIDADEEVTPSLQSEIAAVVSKPSEHAGFLARYHYFFLGSLLRHGAPLWKLVLFKHRLARYEQIDVPEFSASDLELHAHPVVRGPVGRLRSPMIHHDFEDLHHHFERHNIYSDWDYHGPDGFTAEFGESIQISDQSTTTPPGCTPTGPPYSATWTAVDGSGFILSATAAPSATVYPRSGGSISPPVNSSTGSGSGTMIDSNGNEITVTASTNTTITDTLGTTAITAAGNGTPSSPTTYTYTPAAGGSATVTVNYTAYTVQTNFGCTGISDYGPTSNNLVSSITLPDGTSYSFTYEPTPGHAGNVTGRLASITLSTGGQITYAYSGSNNGITCNYAIAPTLTRTTPDGTWTYTHTESGSAWTTTTTDPQSNQTLYNFQVASGVSNGYETEPKVYQGSSGSGTLLETVDTCIPDVAGFCLGMAVLPLVAAFAAVLYTILYTAIYVAPFVCLGHYVWRRCCR